MRATTGAATYLLVIAAACGGSDPEPSLTITPDGSPHAVTTPTEFTAKLVNSDEPITWTLSGGGSISSTTGSHTVFVPPSGTGSETLTATAGSLTSTITITSGPQVLTEGTIPGLSAPVTVTWDAQEIPHIKCAQAKDCFAVQGYVQAHDRLYSMDFLRHVSRGRLAEMIGVAGLSQDVQLRTLFITRDGKALASALVEATDPSTKAMLDAFTAGINAYITGLKTTSGTSPLGGEYAQLPYRLTANDLDAWTDEDTWAIARLNQFQLSESIEAEVANGRFYQAYRTSAPDKVAAWIRAAAPTTERAHTLAANQLAFAPAAAPAPMPKHSMTAWGGVLATTYASMSQLRDALRPANTDVGSNNWVVAGTKSATGAAMVANDPHLGLQYPPLFHLATLTSSNPDDHLNLAGGAFPGLPGALVGRGAHVGWGVTVVGYDVTDVYLEQLAPCATSPAGLCAQTTAGPVPMLPVPQTFQVRTAGGVVDATTLTLPTAQRPPAVVLINPKHGPVISLDPTTGAATTVRWTGQEGTTQDLRAFLGLDVATDVDNAMDALKYYATGAQNFVLADDQGNIAYDPHALVPVRRFANPAVVGANVKPPWFPLPGDGTAEWGDGASDCAAVNAAQIAACWIADTALPQGKNPAKGYFFTANSDPTATGVTDDNNPLAHQPYLSFAWDDSSGFRATRIDELLAGKLAGTGKVSLADMQAIQADHVSRPGKAFVTVIKTLPVDNDASVSAARAVLDAWETNGYDCPSGLLGSDPVQSAVDTTPAVVANSAGCFLFHTFLRHLASNVFADDLGAIGQSYGALDAIKAMLYMLVERGPTDTAGSSFCNDAGGAQHTCGAQVLTALGEAYREIAAEYGSDPSKWTWGRVHTMQPVPLLALITTDYSPGPYARPGGAFTVDVGTPSVAASGLAFPYSSGSNVRHISVMASTPIVKMQLPGPERDVPALIEGSDLLGGYALNQYFDFAFGDQSDAVAVSTQTFKAQ
jgi:penicillin amidase